MIYNVFDRRGPELEQLSDVINNRFGIAFEGEWMLVVRWSEVAQFGSENTDVVSLVSVLPHKN